MHAWSMHATRMECFQVCVCVCVYVCVCVCVLTSLADSFFYYHIFTGIDLPFRVYKNKPKIESNLAKCECVLFGNFSLCRFHTDCGSTIKVKHSFVRELGNTQEFQNMFGCMLPLISDLPRGGVLFLTNSAYAGSMHESTKVHTP